MKLFANGANCCLLMLLLGCGPSAADRNASEDTGRLVTDRETNSVIESATGEAVASAGTSSRDETRGSEIVESSASRDIPTDEPEELQVDPVDLCFQDYCPCEPPQGGPDKGLCRQLRAGIPVDDELMAAAAMLRDSRQQMEDFERDNPGFIE